ncbi:hypothetical protein T492DRAFT_497895 [Pavlovales sp. CCMP2436]|nr:hypothetical protein T492DRAFT_497895 [Pavlovales sp. CCMP2436]
MAAYSSASLLAKGAAPDTSSPRDDNQFTASISMFEFVAQALSEGELLQLLQQEFVPVCYGGSFAVARANVHTVSQGTFARLRALMERGDSIEEGHYAERLWAALLAPRMTPAESAAFKLGVGSDYWVKPDAHNALIPGKGTQGNTYGGLVKRCCCAKPSSS